MDAFLISTAIVAHAETGDKPQLLALAGTTLGQH
jgi:putative Ca2+/H+ antiporter (TMEM165/GDT1 family)